MNLENKVIIVTVASSGIGRAAAHKLAQHGAKVVLMACSEDELNELKSNIEAKGRYRIGRGRERDPSYRYRYRCRYHGENHVNDNNR